jgi:polyhydroxybutyrate depolymerase
MTPPNDGDVSRRPAVAIAAISAMGALVAACAGDTSQESGPSSPSSAPAASTTPPASSRAWTPGRHDESFDVGGTTRSAVVIVPENTSRPVPLVFAFHGHGGSGTAMARKSNIEGLWPEAIVLYPDGLVGHRGKTDPAGAKPGWQTAVGEDADRDLAFFDTMLATVRSKVPVDPDRIYLVGHSNGSAFASLLSNQRGDAVAATANLSSQPSARLLQAGPARSMFMAMGTHDMVVPYATQQRSILLAEQKLGADPNRATVDGPLRSEPGRGRLELETYLYPGGHAMPPPAPRLIVEFFRRHTLSSG